MRKEPICHPERIHRSGGLCNACYWKKYYKDHPSRDRARFLKKTYNITLDEYNILLEKQKGVCAICGVAGFTRSLNVDHNHKTHKIRGLLCHLCNRALGQLKADVRLNIGKSIDRYLNPNG